VARAEAEQARDKEAALRQQVELALARAEKAECVAQERNEDYRRSLYTHSIQLADAKYREGNIVNARKRLESCPEDLRGWEWNRVNHVLDHSVMSLSAHDGHVTSVVLSPDAKRVVSAGSDRAIKVWDITSGKELISIAEAHSGRIYHVEFSPNSKHIVSCSDSGEVKVWDTADVNEPKFSKQGKGGTPRASFSPDGSRIVSAMTPDGTIKVWDIKTGAEVLSVSSEKRKAKFAMFSPDGKQIVSANWGGTVTFWDAVSGDEVESYAGYDQKIHTMSFDSNGSLFVSMSSGYGGYRIKIWDVIKGSIAETFYGHRGWIEAVAFSPDDKYIISGSYDSTVRIWDIATGEERRNLRGHEDVVTSVQFTPDGKQAVSGSWDGTIKVWDVTVDREINRFVGHRRILTSIAFSPDGKSIAGSTWGKAIVLWDSAAPEGGYEPRKIGMAARRMVDGLHETHGLYQASLPYSAGTLWSFTEGELVSFWDFNDVENGVVNNRIVGGPQVRLANGGHIVVDAARGSVLDLRESKVESTQESNCDITGAISVGAWVKLRPSREGWYVIVSKGDPGWGMLANSKAGSVMMSVHNLKHENTVGANMDLTDDHWHHVIGTYDGEKACLYIDGELGNSKRIRGNIPTNNRPVVIGDLPELSERGYDLSWNGLIDDVCIYSYALSADEVKDLYEGREPPREKKRDSAKTE
jgi:WD40 repeat protein